MEKPNFTEIAERLESYSQNLKDNSQLGNSKLMLAFAEMITVMGWQSSQQDTNNIQVANLIGEIKVLQTTIEEANKNSGILEEANYKLQRILVALTAVLALVAIFPVFEAVFQWLTPVVTQALKVPNLSLTVINIISAAISGITVFLAYSRFRRMELSETIKVSDSVKLVLKDKDGKVKKEK